MRIVDLLRDLQELDSQLDNARASLAQVRLTIGERSALDRLESEVAGARNELHRIEATQRDLELQADTIRTKVTAEEKRLYGGTITNPKELGSLSDEIAQEKRRLSGLEDKVLALMEENEEAAQQLDALETSLIQQTDGWTSSQAQAKRRAQELEQAVQQLDARRATLAGQVDGPTRSTYDTLRRQKGSAIAQVAQRTCQACRVALTPALEQRARIGADLVACHSCGRILYVAIS
jgi:hypothetical protein